jgi:hypothetical protein
MIQHKVSARKEDQYTVHCDACGETTPRQNFETAGDAADHARIAGFVTKFASMISPAKWECPKHSKKSK